MNDDDLLFPADNLERWKRRELPKDWLVNLGSPCAYSRASYASPQID